MRRPRVARRFSGYQRLVGPSLLNVARKDDAHTAQRLTDERIVWFGSTRPDGRPHQVPVWFRWQDPELVVFTGADAQKLHNVRHQPSVALHLDTAMAGGDIVLLDGTAAIVDDGAVSHLVPGFARKYAPLLGSAGLSAWRTTFSQPILITATRVVAWTRTGGQLAYRSVPEPTGD